jgi:CheY-like chemotaxis protein
MGSISILLADDSITIQKVVGIIFGSDDYSLTIVDNGKAAVQKAQELQPDVLLIDALMPGMSGYEVCEAIRKDASLATKPVLLLTGSFEPFDEDKARQCGADDHIIKPFESQQIVAKVQELYQLGVNRASGLISAADAAVVSDPGAVKETFAFEQTADETAFAEESPSVAAPSFTFNSELESEIAVTFAAPAVEHEPLRVPDDPWGAFTQQPTPSLSLSAPPVEESEQLASPFDSVQPDLSSLVTEETTAFPVEQAHQDQIGSSWVPVEEQTFEFREEIAVMPPEVVEEPAAIMGSPEPEPAFTPDAFEPVVTAAPLSDQLAVTEQQPVSPVKAGAELVAEVSSAAIALSDDQLKVALLSASKETIERIVWEVVPDLAEAMIKEAIRRITEGK